jgi:hypothetical protein
VIEFRAEMPVRKAVEALKSGGSKMNANENPDHARLKQLLQEAKPLMLPLYPEQQKAWLAESPLAQEINSILAKHPEYYDDVRAVVGGDVFPKPRS